MQNYNVVSVSGGKDSTATLLLALERGAENIKAVFADTGNEHQLTYDYIEYLEEFTGIPIQRVKADFSARIARKRQYVQTHWAADGVPQHLIDRAVAVLQPTGNPFLDLCIWKGRFPSSKAQFCTQELKISPILQQVFIPLLSAEDTQDVYSWQGVRHDESLRRSTLPETDEVMDGLFNYRPILSWSVDQVFEFIKTCGCEHNPLYLMGMGRVGCMPCVNCTKAELKQIALRFPEVVARIEEWELIVSEVSKRGCSTFFPAVNDPTVHRSDLITPQTHGIRRMVSWANTRRGGRQFDLEDFNKLDVGCSSAYGLCDTGSDVPEWVTKGAAE